MAAMKQLLHPQIVRVSDRDNFALYDASVEKERRIVQALETQEVLARACRDSQARRFPLWASHPQWALKPILIRLPLAIWQTVKQEWAR